MLALVFVVGCWIALAITLLGVVVLAPKNTAVLVAMLAFLLTFFVAVTVSVILFTVAFAFAITHDSVLPPRATLSSADMVVTADAFEITITSLTIFFIADLSS